MKKSAVSVQNTQESKISTVESKTTELKIFLQATKFTMCNFELTQDKLCRKCLISQDDPEVFWDYYKISHFINKVPSKIGTMCFL